MNTPLYAEDYEHPTDKIALETLQKIPFLDKVLTWWLNLHIKADVLVDYRGNGIEVNEKTSPRVWKLKQIAKDRLSIDDDIPIFITREWQYNAFATGVTTPVIVLHSSIVEDFSNDELLYIIGHEMGHVKSKHMLYHYMAESIAQWAYNCSIVNAIALQAIVVAVTEWQRKSELTADRAGFIANQNKEACIWAMMKLMGLPADYMNNTKYNFSIYDPLEQYIESNDAITSSTYQKVIYAFITAKLTHPWTIERAHEIQKWEGIKRV